MRPCTMARRICCLVPMLSFLMLLPDTRSAWSETIQEATPTIEQTSMSLPVEPMDLEERMRFLEGLSRARPIPMPTESTPRVGVIQGPNELLRLDARSRTVTRLERLPSPETMMRVPGSEGVLLPSIEVQDGGDGMSGIGSPLAGSCTPPSLDLQTYGFPWRTVVKLLMRFNVAGTDYYYVCSAATVHPFHLLTAAHCIYNFDPDDDGDESDARYAEEVWAWPAQTDNVNPFANCDGMCPTEQDFPWGVSKVRFITTYDAWVDDHDYDYDMAFLTLDRRIGNYVGWMGAEAEVETSSLNFDGYPAETPYVPPCTVGPYPGYDDDNVESYSTHRIDLCAYTYGGHSGGPAWRFFDDERFIQGVNSTSDRMGSAEETRLTPGKLSDLFDTLIPSDEATNPPTPRPELIEYVFETDAKDVLDNDVCQGTDLELEYNIFNVGYEESGDITVYFYLSSDLCITTDDYFIGSVSLPSLGDGLYYNPTTTLTVPCDVPPGSYYAGWIMTCATEEYGTGDNAAVIGNETVTVTSASTPPDITVEATGGSVDVDCEFQVAFDATVTDDCGVLAADVDVSAQVVSGEATLGTPSVNAVQTDDNTVDVDGTVLVTEVTACPAVIEITVLATDLCGNSSDESDTAHVVDEIPPDISIMPEPDVLWPPNHKLATITVGVDVEDACDAGATFVLTDVTSNEPDNGLGDGDTEDDIQGDEEGTADTEFQLRSERAGGGDGRIYTITYTATDGCGNSADAVGYVTVPHDQSGSAMASSGFVDDGSQLSPTVTEFYLVIPANVEGSDDVVDPRTVDPTRSIVGNLLGRIAPLSSWLADADGDGAADLILEYPAGPARQLAEVSAQVGDPVCFRYEEQDGDGYLVSDIFALGDPVQLPSRSSEHRGTPPEEGIALGDQGENPPTVVPSRTGLVGIQPNPFGPSTTVQFDLGQAGPVRIEVYNPQGARVRTLVEGYRPAGRHSTVWDGRDGNGHQVASGVYLFRFAGDGVEEVQRVVLMR